MRRLLQRTQSADLDLSDTNRDVREQYAGKDQDKRRTEQTARLTRLEGVLKTARKTKKGPTLAVAAADVARIKMSLAVLGAGVKADEIVALAEEAHAAAPSAATQAVLVNALFHRAHGALMKQETTYAALANRARRSLDFRYLIAVAVTRDPKARAAALANKDVQRGLALEKETFALFPDAPDEWVYAMLRAAGDKAAEDMGKAIQTDLEHVQRELQLKLSPLSAGVAFDLYWACQAAGQEAKGIEILKQCAARGVPMPFDP
jgi:hypothetical protein